MANPATDAPPPERLSESQRMTRRTLAADVITSADAEALLKACSRRAPTGIRNAALIAVLWRCGLRVSEALALLPSDVDLDEGLIRIRRGKGGKARVVGIDAGTAALMTAWVSVRRGLPCTLPSPLFCTLKGGRIDDSYVRRLLPRLAARAGVEKRVHAHGLRHAFALALDREGAPLTTIRDLLGHASAQTTDVYLRRLGASTAVEFARGRHWTPPRSREVG
jgi:integrase/recombinase XerD